MVAVANAVNARGNLRCSHTTVHKILTSKDLPSNGYLLFEIVDCLIDMSRFSRQGGEDDALDTLDSLWRKAMEHDLLAPPSVGGFPELAPPALSGDASVALDAPSTPHHVGGVIGRQDDVGEADTASIERTGANSVDYQQSSSVSRPDFTPQAVVDVLIDGPRDARLPVADKSRAVVVGASMYDDDALPPLFGVATGVRQVVGQLHRPGGALHSADVTVLESPSRLELLDAVDDAARQAEDLLLLYFMGHGLLSQASGGLLLAAADTRQAVEYTAVNYDDLRQILTASRASKKLVVLDTCFAGKAIDTLGFSDGVIDTPTTAVIAATTGSGLAFSTESSTQFSQAFTDILADGITGAGPLLDVHDIYQALCERAATDGFPRPAMRASSSRGFFLCTNPAFRESRVSQEEIASVLSWKDFGRLLERERKATGASQRELAARTAALEDDGTTTTLHRSIVTEMEQGRAITAPRLRTYLDACETSDVESWVEALDRVAQGETFADADRQLISHVIREDRAWDVLADQLARYGLAVLNAWMTTGHVFVVASAAGMAIAPTVEDLSLLADDPIVRDEIADEAVTRALQTLRKQLNETGAGNNWAGHVSLPTQFTTLCVRAFVDEFRQYKRRNASWHDKRQVRWSPEEFQHHEAITNTNADDVLVERIEANDDVTTALAHLSERDRQIVWALSLGYKPKEIAELLGETSPRAVEARIYRLRKRYGWLRAKFS